MPQPRQGKSVTIPVRQVELTKLNTDGIVLDVTAMRQILSWEARQGIMRVEPGVTLVERILEKS